MRRLFLLCLLLAACEERQAAPVAEIVPPVLVAPARLESLTPERRLPGTVRPRVESDLGFQVPGKLVRRRVDAGQTVAAGDVLAELDRADFTLQLAQAEAEQAAAEASRDVSLTELERIASLRRSGWSTASEHDRLRAAAEEATGRAARARHAVGLARNALDHAVLRADAAGIITAVLAEPGQVLAQGQPALRLARLEGLEVEVAVPETLLGVLHGTTATASLWALPGMSHPVRLREISPRADPATRTYAARFSLPDGAPVRWGMTATVTLHPPALSQGVPVPLAALQDNGSGPSVFVVDPANATITRRPVRLGLLGAGHAVVVEGLAAGELVVQLGAQKLVPGQRVRPLTRLPS